MREKKDDNKSRAGEIIQHSSDDKKDGTMQLAILNLHDSDENANVIEHIILLVIQDESQITFNNEEKFVLDEDDLD